jgi:phosphate:Na+ symporter
MMILELLGGLGVFLYGMRIMSSGLQKVAGNRLRGMLAMFTRNRFTGIVSGFLMTCSVQSSSATTVMIVSFSNAGLLTLTQAIGPVMGANIGTTITGWLVSILGFKVNIAAFALPIVGIGFPLTMLKNTRAKHWGETAIGFGLLFLGLMFLKDAVPSLGEKGSTGKLEFLQDWAMHGYMSVLLFVLVGTVLTVVIQSSSATMAITITLLWQGWIGLDVAAAMVLGENIGTTITAYIASVGANRTAKRVARCHLLFNIIGVLWSLPVLHAFVSVIESMLPTGADQTPEAAKSLRTVQLAAFHTSFNLINTGVLVWFVPQIKAIAEWMIPYQDNEKEVSQIRYFDAGLQQTPELAAVEVRRALQTMMTVVRDMFHKIVKVIEHPEDKLGDIVDEIKKGEDHTDHLETEIVEFCTQLSRQATSPGVAREVAAGFDMANDIERMGDHCFNIILLAQRSYDNNYVYSRGSRNELSAMMSAVEEFITLVVKALGPQEKAVISEARVLESKINAARDQARKVHAKLMQSGELDVRPGLVYIDMMTNFEKLGDYCYNVAEMVSRHMQRRM